MTKLHQSTQKLYIRRQNYIYGVRAVSGHSTMYCVCKLLTSQLERRMVTEEMELRPSDLCSKAEFRPCKPPILVMMVCSVGS